MVKIKNLTLVMVLGVLLFGFGLGACTQDRYRLNSGELQTPSGHSILYSVRLDNKTGEAHYWRLYGGGSG